MIEIDMAFRDQTVGYVRAITLGAPGIFMFLALRFTTEGIGHTRPIMFTSIFALACNVLLNYALMFGHFGAPALGVVGCGLASAISLKKSPISINAGCVLFAITRTEPCITKMAPAPWSPC